MENTELIERYFEGRLSPSERQVFETRLMQEPALSDEMALQRRLREGLRAAGRARMLAQLDAVEGKMSAYHPPTQVLAFDQRSRQRVYWAAAALVPVLILAYWFLRPAPAANDLFAQYFTPYRSTASAAPAADPVSRALQHYRDKNYAQALPALERLAEAATAPDSVLFYKANVHLQLNQPAAAAEELKKIGPESGFYGEAQWYLAMAYLRGNHPDSAKTVLAKIAQNASHAHQERAESLLEKMK